jgi:hypothetical protein
MQVSITDRRLPTEPSFFPTGSLKLTPTHTPLAKLVVPTYRTTPTFPRPVLTLSPITNTSSGTTTFVSANRPGAAKRTGRGASSRPTECGDRGDRDSAAAEARPPWGSADVATGGGFGDLCEVGKSNGMVEASSARATPAPGSRDFGGEDSPLFPRRIE